MSVQNFSPDSEFGAQLKAEIAKQLTAVDDSAYVAEYLLVLISNNRTPTDIVDEFNNLFGNIIDEQFVNNVINEINKHQNGEVNVPQSAFGNQPQPPSQQQELQTPSQLLQQPQPQQQLPTQSLSAPTQQVQIPTGPAQSTSSSFIPAQSAFSGQTAQMQDDNNMMIDGENAEIKGVRFSENTQPSFSQSDFSHNGNTNMKTFNFNKPGRNVMNFKNGGAGGGRGGRGAGRVGATKRQNNMSKMIEMSLDNNMDMTTNFVGPSGGNRPSERCKDFPHCSNKLCQFAHPTRICRAFPNCPHQNQTCTYLHPGEDDELYKEFERVRDAKRSVRDQPRNTGITLCKFGAICQKELCPFAHPTPANKDAKVTLLQWCVDNKECKNATCPRAHSSPHYKPETAPRPHAPATAFASADAGGPSASNGVEKTLEQCKFGTYCKNHRCPKRHASSPVLCREGANCTRMNCYFTHPINEVCRFGVKCTNVNCAFQHPDGKQVQSGHNHTGNKVWVNGQTQSTGGTAERQFAVSEDQVLEQAPSQEVNM